MAGNGKEKVILTADTKNHIFILDLNLRKAKVDFQTLDLEKNIGGIVFDYYLFAKNSNNATPNTAKFRMNYCKMSENDIQIRNYIPCKSVTAVTNADGNSVPANTKGLYDLVTGEFYTNQNTDSEVDFIPGPEV